MTLAYWCILLAALIPLGCAYYGKLKGGFKLKDNASPREFWAHAQGAAARANAAQANSYEVFPPFAAAVLVAHATGNATQWWIDGLAAAFVITRVLYTIAYVADKPSLRSPLWGLGFLCIVGLFVVGAW